MASAVPQYDEWLGDGTVESLGVSLGDPPLVRAVRREALRSFRELALEPNPLYRKYGYFAGVDLTHLDPAVGGAPVQLPAEVSGTARIVHDASGTRVQLPSELEDAGVRIETLPHIWSEGDEAVRAFLPSDGGAEDRLSALARAVVNRGYRLTIPDRVGVPVRVQDLTVLSGPHEALSVHRSIHVGRSSRLLMSEESYSTSESSHQRLLGSSVQLQLAEDARASYLSVHAPDPQAIGLYSRRADLGRAARLGWVWTGFGGFRTRARNVSTLSGSGSDLEDLQTFFGRAQQAYDSAVQISHVGTDTHGQSITRGVFQDESRGMSRGLVRIEKEARKTVSYLSEHAMLLSKGARSDTIPILEILCRDVKATHSSSVAPVDPEKVFYLESRGMNRSDSIRMISEGFLSHVLTRAPIANLRELLYPLLAARWSGAPVTWTEGKLPALPRLELASDVPETDWRFDTKLR